MKIKTFKKMNLPELIQYVWEKEDYPNRFVNNFNGEVVFNGSGKFMTDESFISHNSLFTVEVEEELKEKTPLKDFDLVGLIRKRGREKAYYEIGEWSLSSDTKVSISGIKDIYDLKSLHKINDDDSLTLLYTEEHGIPEEGMIELWTYL